MGTSLVATRFGVSQFAPFTFVTARLMLATAGFLVVYLFDRRRHSWPKQRQLWRQSLIVSAVGPAVQMTIFAISLQYLSSGMVAILITTFPVLIVLAAHVLLHDEKLSRQRGLGVLLAMTGAILLAVQQQSGLPDVTAGRIGYVLIGLALLAGTAETIYTRKYMRTYDSFDVTALRILIGTAIMVVVSSLWTGIDLEGINGQGYFSLIYAALVGTIIAFVLRFDIIKRFGATASAMINYVIPITATLGGVLILDEIVTVWMVAGMAVILLGIALVTDNPLPIRLTSRWGA